MDNSSGIRNATVARREDNSKLRPLDQAEYSEDRDGTHSVTKSLQKLRQRVKGLQCADNKRKSFQPLGFAPSKVIERLQKWSCYNLRKGCNFSEEIAFFNSLA